jgi:hypothetical protein
VCTIIHNSASSTGSLLGQFVKQKNYALFETKEYDSKPLILDDVEQSYRRREVAKNKEV